jgi:hypothetical protein
VGLINSLLLSVTLVSSSVHAFSMRTLKQIPICNDREYLIKNYFYLENEQGHKEKKWHRYYGNIDESSQIEDISMSLMREVKAPDTFKLVFSKKGKTKPEFTKDFILKRKDREFYLVDFDYKKEIPSPQKDPGLLQIVLLNENKPICRIQQMLTSISNN